MAGKPWTISVPFRDPIAAAVVLSASMSSDDLDVLVRLLVGAPDLPADVDTGDDE